MLLLKSLFLFFISGLLEIGGGYLIWLWLKENKSFWYGISGCIMLSLYGIMATFQTTVFARTYIAYGGIFIAMSVLFAYRFEGFKPDKYDIIGVCMALTGVSISIYTSRV